MFLFCPEEIALLKALLADYVRVVVSAVSRIQLEYPREVAQPLTVVLTFLTPLGGLDKTGKHVCDSQRAHPTL